MQIFAYQGAVCMQDSVPAKPHHSRPLGYLHWEPMKHSQVFSLLGCQPPIPELLRGPRHCTIPPVLVPLLRSRAQRHMLLCLPGAVLSGGLNIPARRCCCSSRWRTHLSCSVVHSKVSRLELV